MRRKNRPDMLNCRLDLVAADDEMRLDQSAHLMMIVAVVDGWTRVELTLAFVPLHWPSDHLRGPVKVNTVA